MDQVSIGTIVEGKITGITKFGAFLEFGGKSGMVHISEVAATYVKEISDHLKIGDIVKAKILSISEDGKISLSIKRATVITNEGKSERAPSAPKVHVWQPKPTASGDLSFEDMMKKFQQNSEERMSDIKRGIEAKRGSGPRKR